MPFSPNFFGGRFGSPKIDERKEDLGRTSEMFKQIGGAGSGNPVAEKPGGSGGLLAFSKVWTHREPT